MFNGFTEQTIDFMWGIRLNNEKSWFEAHKDEYKAVLANPMSELADYVYGEFSAKHPQLSLKLHISRIYRDARRLHGNGPYKDHLWFTMRRCDDEWTDKPVFWFELAPESWSYGLGYYCAKASTMAKHRARIDSNPKPLEQLMRRLNKQDEFVLEGGCYAKPKGNPGSLLFDWYNKKTFSIIHGKELGQEAFSVALAQHILQGFEFLVPFYDYFVTLDSDPDPSF